MKDLSPDHARALSRIAQAVADLWDLHARLSSTATARPGVKDAERSLRKAAAKLARLRDWLAATVESLPTPSTEDDLEHPFELSRAAVECVLADHLEPAIRTLTRMATIQSRSRKQARASVECLLVDHLIPAIHGLSTALLVVHEEGSAHADVVYL